jgi:hypothetical protein
MSIGLAFWIVYLVYLVLSLWFRWGNASGLGEWAVNMVLLFLLGWGCFGFALRG